MKEHKDSGSTMGLAAYRTVVQGGAFWSCAAQDTHVTAITFIYWLIHFPGLVRDLEDLQNN